MTLVRCGFYSESPAMLFGCRFLIFYSISLPGMVPYPEPYQSQFQQRRLGALGIEWRPSMIKYAVGPEFSVDQDYPLIPLIDLEGMFELQPELTDAMFWEPEYDIASDDNNDSEYNVNEDNSSAAEQGSVSAISSSDLECSEDDSSSRDGLRRSRRKKHKVEVSGIFILFWISL